MLSIEQIEKDVVEFFAIKRGNIDILPGTSVCVYNIDEYDLIDLELELEEKYDVVTDGEECLCLSSEDTLGEISQKLFDYLKLHKKDE